MTTSPGITGQDQRHGSPRRIVLAYDAPPPAETLDGVGAEYEDQATIDWLCRTLESIAPTTPIPWGPRFVSALGESGADLVFNITEASGSRNRESLVPALCEAFGIPCTGSDALALGVSLDKTVTKELASGWGVRAPAGVLLSRIESGDDAGFDVLSPPLIVKPNTGGSSLGIHTGSLQPDLPSALEYARRLRIATHDDIIIETFIPGREITVALLERDGRLEVFPHAELIVGSGTPDEFYTAERKQRHEKRIECPARLDPAVERTLTEWSVGLFRNLGCSGFARIDFRLEHDRPYLLEVNPLPGLSPYYGIYQRQAGAAGLSGEAVIAAIVEHGYMHGKKKDDCAEAAG